MRNQKVSKPTADSKTNSTDSHQIQSRPFMPAIQAKQVPVSPPDFTQEQLQESPQQQSAGFNFGTISLFTDGATPVPSSSRLVQAKLTLGQPNDKYEQEADSVAKSVVQQINSNPDLAQQDDSIQRMSFPGSPLMRLPIQRQGEIPVGPTTDQFETSLNRARSGGHTLEPRLQAQMGQAMGADFSGVKVHTDVEADQLNQSIQAKAFATGQDVFFRQGAYDPSSQGGQELIAHELTHVVQQNGNALQAKQIQRAETQPSNQTGMSDQLKSGIENLSGISMDDVRVHYNSPKPFEIGALAYASGSDIHIGPKQEEHLSHEAWHVVQQKQGRVAANTQLKGMALNNRDALEHEADVMGAKAATYGHQNITQPLQHKAIQRSVIQARLPEMSESQIRDNQEAAREILLHSLRNIDDSEAENLLASLGDQMVRSDLSEESDELTMDMVADIIRTTDAVEILHNAYQYLITYLGEDKHFSEEAHESQPPEGDQMEAIASKLPGIVTELNTTIGKPEELRAVFGLDDVSSVIQVYQNAKKGIEGHIANQTCPITLAGNKEHNQWVGVGGMTSFGSPVVDLGSGAAKGLASGSLEGKTTLIHELTHALGNTKDHAYTSAGCAKLGPAKRVRNAKTYEHGYLEATGKHKESHIYNPDVASGKRAVKKSGLMESEIATIRKKKFGDVNGLIAEVWNHTDDCFLAAQRLANGTPLQEANEIKMVQAATTPHQLTITPENKQIVLALIEDRTHAINEVKKDLKTGIKLIEIDTLKQMEAGEVLAELIHDKINESVDVASAWVYYMTDLNRALG